MKKRLFLILTLTLLIISSAALTGCIDSEDGGESSQSSPQDTLELFIKRINKRDGEGTVELGASDLLKVDKYEDMKSSFKENISDENTATIDNYEVNKVVYEEGMTQDNKSKMNDIVNSIYENSTTKVENTCIIDLEWTTTQDGETETATIMFPMIKIDNKWYVSIIYMMLPSGGGGETPVAGDLTYRSIDSNPNNGNATFSITMNTPNEANYGDIKITILNDDGNSVLSTSSYTGTSTYQTDTSTNVWLNHTQIGSTGDKIAGGDRITIESNWDNLSGYEIVISIDGYSGSINSIVP